MQTVARVKPGISLAFATEVLTVEATAIRMAAERLDDSFERALQLVDQCTGKVITMGVGKSGIAARKLSATLTSTGCPSVFLHPSEAMHGDLGIVLPDDIVIALSNGGETDEILAVLPAILSRCVPIIAVVGEKQSTLAKRATVVLDASIEREACPLNLAPTTSVVVALALGDALAMTLQKLRGIRPEDFALNHPGGRLGRRLTLRVRDVMPDGPRALPIVAPSALLMDVLCEITEKCLGATCVAGSDSVLLGIITDYDIRRTAQRLGPASFAVPASDLMNRSPAVVLTPDQLASDALRLMEDRGRPISVAPVVDEQRRCLGMVRVHDFVRAGL